MPLATHLNFGVLTVSLLSLHRDFDLCGGWPSYSLRSNSQHAGDARHSTSPCAMPIYSILNA